MKKIGKRIKEARKETKRPASGGKLRSYSMEGLQCKIEDELHIPFPERKTLSKVERGELDSLTLPQFLAICEFFDCDAGYLLCEYDYRTDKNRLICEETGLWEENLPKLKNNCKISRLINALLSYKNIGQLSLSFDWLLRYLFPSLALRAKKSALEKRKGASPSESKDISDAQNSILGKQIDQECYLSRFDRDTEKLFREFQAEITDGSAPCLEKIDKEINGG